MEQEHLPLWRRPVEVIGTVAVALVVCVVGIPVASDHGWPIAGVAVAVAEMPVFGAMALLLRRGRR